ncbi:hypothetical protein BKA63DRAFT_141854 [Paraphoma chrysanthemicola]|nr:hypothetical protein BKA63DRAFT_141854 [Paraphoma chrysanthemicola]
MGHNLEVAIPRGPFQTYVPPRKRAASKDRIPKACRYCHKRKIKCSGELPRCSLCEKTKQPCIYEASKKDRLASAHDRIQHLATLLKDLSGKVDVEAQARIESVLSENEVPAPLPESVLDFSSAPSTSSDSPLFSDVQYDQQHTATKIQTQPGTSRTSDPSSPMNIDNSQTFKKSYAPSQYTTIDDTGGLVTVSNLDIAAQSQEAPGQICEAQWLASLKKRLQDSNSL